MDRERMAEKLIRAWRTLNIAVETGMFGEENVFTKAQDDIADALLVLADEAEHDYQTSETYIALHSTWFNPEESARKLLAFDGKQPCPVFFDNEQIEKMKKVNGGYVYE